MVYIQQKLPKEKVFKDPVHGYVNVYDQLIWDLIATPEFQRLRRIHQLGTTSFTFHGAEHSRFNHSLGVYEIVRRIIDLTFANECKMSDEERLVALAAALLHDLGHGPFSHAFEKVFGTDHEDYTLAIITGATNVRKVLMKAGEDFPEKVASVIKKNYPNQTIVKLISSQLDADRMDYLLRDAYYTGVSYGKFDMERILRVLRPSPDNNSVIIKYSGMHAVEDYLMSRYQMYQQVYFHPLSRSGEVILWKILERAKSLSQAGYEFAFYSGELTSFFENGWTLADYVELDDSVLLFYFRMWQKEKDAILSDLCDRFLNRRLFRYVDYNPVEDSELYTHVKRLLEKADVDPNYYLVIDSSSDLPYDLYKPGASSGKKPIQLLMPNGELHELSTKSPIVESIGGKIETDVKLYYPFDFLENRKIPLEIAKEIKLLLHDHSVKKL